jgi:hypothetical protein
MPLTTSGVTQIIRRRCRQAGIPQLHPHQFRHWSASEHFSQGMSDQDAMARKRYRGEACPGALKEAGDRGPAVTHDVWLRRGASPDCQLHRPAGEALECTMAAQFGELHPPGRLTPQRWRWRWDWHARLGERRYLQESSPPGQQHLSPG